MPSVEPAYVERLLKAGEPIVVIDVRSAESYRKAHIPGARSVPLSEIEWRINDVPRSGRVLLYGDSAFEVTEVYAILRTRGYRNVAVLRDGFPAWRERGFPVEGIP